MKSVPYEDSELIGMGGIDIMLSQKLSWQKLLFEDSLKWFLITGRIGKESTVLEAWMEIVELKHPEDLLSREKEKAYVFSMSFDYIWSQFYVNIVENFCISFE